MPPMRPYEIAIIYDTSLEESDAREITNRVGELVRSRGGRSGRVDWWGRRAFAYEMKHRNEGYYAFVEVTAEPETVAEVNRMLSLSDAVLRHRVIRQPERPAPARPTGAPGSGAGTRPATEASGAAGAGSRREDAGQPAADDAATVG